jgi:hypothetical protein
MSRGPDSAKGGRWKIHKIDTELRVYHAVDTVPGEAVELHEVVDLLLGGSEQGRVRGVLGTAVLKLVHRQLLATFVQKTIDYLNRLLLQEVKKRENFFDKNKKL